VAVSEPERGLITRNQRGDNPISLLFTVRLADMVKEESSKYESSCTSNGKACMRSYPRGQRMHPPT
jgi:hypothetical protein